VASIFLLLRQKKDTKEKATPDRSKARNKINSLRRRQNSRFASVEPLKQVVGLKPQTVDFKAARFTGTQKKQKHRLNKLVYKCLKVSLKWFFIKTKSNNLLAINPK